MPTPTSSTLRTTASPRRSSASRATRRRRHEKKKNKKSGAGRRMNVRGLMKKKYIPLHQPRSTAWGGAAASRDTKPTVTAASIDDARSGRSVPGRPTILEICNSENAKSKNFLCVGRNPRPKIAVLADLIIALLSSARAPRACSARDAAFLVIRRYMAACVCLWSLAASPALHF